MRRDNETTRRGAWVMVPTWPGGRVWRDVKGRLTFHVHRSVNGTHYDLSTRAHTLSAAMKQWDRFQADPEAYDPRGTTRAEPIYLSEKLSEKFLAWSAAPEKDGGAGNTARWVGQQRLYLATWADKLRKVDLRRASLKDDILPALRKATCRPQRIATLKRLYSWLRKVEHRLSPAEDPTLDTLAVPQSRPEQLKRPKAVPREHIQLVVEKLREPPEQEDGTVSLQARREESWRKRWADLLVVLAGTGMHVSELERFSASGSVESLPRDGRAEGAAGVVVIPSTKAGDPLRVAVSAEVLAAAGRVLAAGSFDRVKLVKAIHSACDALKRPDDGVGIDRFGPGQLRHSVATWAVNAGANPADVAAFLGHKSPRTTRRFYATLATPAKVPTLL